MFGYTVNNKVIPLVIVLNSDNNFVTEVLYRFV